MVSEMKLSDGDIQKMKKRSQKSILWEFHHEILKMRAEDISFQIVKEWLNEQGVDTSVQNIRQFYERNMLAQQSPKQKQGTSIENDGIFSDIAGISIAGSLVGSTCDCHLTTSRSRHVCRCRS